VGDGEGVHPVVVGRVAVAAPDHQDETGKGVAGYVEPEFGYMH
jgi:hypothetical protein